MPKKKESKKSQKSISNEIEKTETENVQTETENVQTETENVQTETENVTENVQTETENVIPENETELEKFHRESLELQSKEMETSEKEKSDKEKEKIRFRMERLERLETEKSERNKIREENRKKKQDELKKQKEKEKEDWIELMKIERHAKCAYNPETLGWEIKMFPDGDKFFPQGFAHSNLELTWIKRTFRDSQKLRKFDIRTMEITDGEHVYIYDIDNPYAFNPSKKSAQNSPKNNPDFRDGRKIIAKGLGELDGETLEGTLISLVGNVHIIEFDSPLNPETKLNLEFKSGKYGMDKEGSKSGWEIISIGDENRENISQDETENVPPDAKDNVQEIVQDENVQDETEKTG